MAKIVSGFQLLIFGQGGRDAPDVDCREGETQAEPLPVPLARWLALPPRRGPVSLDDKVDFYLIGLALKGR